MWQNWIEVLLGLAVVGVAFFGGLTTAFAWTLGIVGLAVTVVAFWSMAELPESGFVKHA